MAECREGTIPLVEVEGRDVACLLYGGREQRAEAPAASEVA